MRISNDVAREVASGGDIGRARLALDLLDARAEIAQLRRDLSAADDRIEHLRMDLATVEREREETQAAIGEEWKINARLYAIVEAMANLSPVLGGSCLSCLTDKREPHRAWCPWLAARAYVDARKPADPYAGHTDRGPAFTHYGTAAECGCGRKGVTP